MFRRLRGTVNLGKLRWLTIGQKLTSTLVPPLCVLCGGPGQRGDELWGVDLCHWCEAACPRPAEPGATASASAAVASATDLDAVRVLFLYEDPVDRLVTGLKFRGELACGRVLGTLLARHIGAAGARRPQLLVPMPLHPTRYRERGFNQSQVVASHVASRTGILLDTGLLRRVRNTAPQTTLTAAERRLNCAGAFAVQPGRHLPPRIARCSTM